MSDFAAAFEEAEVTERQSYLGAGTHTVTVRNAELLAGDEARPPWANKSLKVMLGNDEGIVFADIELDPLTYQDGDINPKALAGSKRDLTNMGCTFDSPKSVAEFSQQAEAFILGGGAHGAEVEINISEWDSDKINPNTNKPYKNRRVYVNKLVSAGLGDAMAAPALEAQVF